MTYASMSIDRREAYYERCAALIAKDPLGFYSRAEAGRRIQSAIKPKDLQPFAQSVEPLPAEAAPAVDIQTARAKRARR